MDTGCDLVQETLVEVAGDRSRLTEAERTHLDSCLSCRTLAAAEHRLAEVLVTAVPPADPAVELAVMRSLKQHRLRRRLVAVLPVAASLVVAGAGAAALGGVPGGSLLGLVPRWSSHGWFAFAGSVSDWAVALAATCRAARLHLPPAVEVGSLAMATLGAAAVVLATRRWRTLLPWSVRD